MNSDSEDLESLSELQKFFKDIYFDSEDLESSSKVQ